MGELSGEAGQVLAQDSLLMDGESFLIQEGRRICFVSSRNRDDFSLCTRRKLAARAGHQCSFCGTPTTGPSDEANDAVNDIGVAAHIAGAAPGSRRYDPNMTREQRVAIENGIWLCQSHAKLIDGDEASWTIEELWQMRSEAEAKAKARIEAPQLPMDEASSFFASLYSVADAKQLAAKLSLPIPPQAAFEADSVEVLRSLPAQASASGKHLRLLRHIEAELIAEARDPDARLALLPNVIAVADAIAYAHSLDIIHRDLKQSNMLVGSFGETFVIDWGLAKDSVATGETGRKSGGLWRQTPIQAEAS